MLLCVISSAVAPSVAPAWCCGRRPPPPASPVGWVSRARVPSLSLSASIAPVFRRLCRPFARGCLCVCPFPLPSVHSPTRYTLPPEAGCRGHHPACGRPRVCAPTRPAASPSRILFALHVLAHSHTLVLAHSHTLTLATHSRSLAHSHSPCPLLAKALSPSCRPCRVHCPCIVSPGIVAVVARSFCSCLSSRHVMLVVSPFPLAVLVMSPLPSPFLAALPCPSAALSSPPPWACRCRQWPQRPPAKFRRGMYRWCRAPWLCAAAAGLIDSWSRPVMEFL